MKSLLKLSAIAAVIALGLQAPAMAEDKAMSAVEKGKEIAFDRKKGNCLTCHAIADGDLAGNSGPPLIVMQSRFKSKSDIRDIIYDISAVRPESNRPKPHFMPLFGKYGVLTDDEIDLVTEFVWSL